MAVAGTVTQCGILAGMRTADVLVKALENEGVRYVFGVPGEENLVLLDALRTSSLKFILTHTEAGAGFMAATVGRLTGKPGVALSTVGPGATNMVTPAAYATLGGMPLLLITGQKPVLESVGGSHFQVVSTTDIMRPVTKFTRQIVAPALVPGLVREAFRLACEERPGTVHLELPEDVASLPSELVSFPVTDLRRPAPDAKAIRRALELLREAQHPLVLVGAGANRKLVSKALLEFLNQTKLPFFVTQLGKGVMDERHPMYLGCAALSDHDYIHCAIKRADLILNIGHDVAEKPPFFMHQAGAKVIHINFLPAHVDDSYFPQLEVVGDISRALDALREGMPEPPLWDTTYVMKLKNKLAAHVLEQTTEERYPMTPQRLVADVRKVMSEQGTITLDNGMYKIWFARNCPAYRPNSLLLDNALATMGAGLPSAIAAKLIEPERPTLAIVGDGGLAMSLGELETAVRLKLDITVLVLRDNGFGMIAWKQQAMNLPEFGLKFENPDIVALAQSFGCQGTRVNSAAELAPCLKQALGKTGVQVIDVAVDYSENERVLGKELADKTCDL